MSSNVRVRVAPSPTGAKGLHIGNIRTCLMNFLWARKNKGSFIYRLENTDLARNSEEGIIAIKNSFEYLGMIPDEGYTYGGDFGPYSQLERLDIYKKFAEKLIDEGKAYRCYCTAEEIEEQRKKLAETNPKANFKYPGTCRDRKDHPKGKDFVVRLKTTTEGYTEYDDLVFGKIRTPNKEMQDVVLMRSNGICLYNFGCVVDDITMKISLVGRARDHMINTPIQLLIYQALGVEPPQFAHLPMVLGQDGSKLSKRHGACSVLEYRDMGYTPKAVLNYLARLGWSCGNQEVFDLDELIEKFDWSACGKNDGKMDPKKFAAIQYEHMKSDKLTSDVEYAVRLMPFLSKNGIANADVEKIKSLIHMIRPKMHNFVDAAKELEPVLKNEIVLDPQAAEKHLTPDQKPRIRSICSHFSDLNSWTENDLRTHMQSWLQANNLTMKDVGQSIRVCVSGRTQSPELFQFMTALGKERTLERLVKFSS